MYASTHICMYADAYDADPHMYVWRYMHACVHVCKLTYTHTYIYMC